MSSSIIEIERLSKVYKLGAFGTGTLSHDLNQWWHKIRRKPDPYLQQAQLNDRTAASSQGYVWSLKDIQFSVDRGDILGIIGSNGAGKSTLLKLISKITRPTNGEIRIDGRVASLLEVGTGFHPDLTGRENIFLNGAILGMRKHEIQRRFDEIVDFSGVEMYLDTPVKKYSSGMYVRLAFAVAAHLEPDILIIDEVLAVGDAAFQAKCLGKMKDVSANKGRTIIFVSHSLATIKSLCNKAVLLEKGLQKTCGDMADVIDVYQQDSADRSDGTRAPVQMADKGHFTGWKLLGARTGKLHACYSGEQCTFAFEFHALQNLQNCEARFLLRHKDLVVLHTSSLANNGVNFSMEAGKHELRFAFELPVRDAVLEVEIMLLSFSAVIDTWTSTTALTIIDNLASPVWPGVFVPRQQFSVVPMHSTEPILST